MKIVLMADNRKTELLVNFCIAYKPLLEKHQLISVYNTAKLLKSAADLDVSGLSVDYSSGFEQLAHGRSRIQEIIQDTPVIFPVCIQYHPYDFRLHTVFLPL